MKKAVSLVFCIFTLLGVLALSAWAENFQYADVNVVKPVGGESPSFSAFVTYPSSGLRVQEGYNSDGYVNGVAWYDVTEERYLTESDVFVSGNTYKCYIWVETEDVNDAIDGNFMGTVIGAENSDSDGATSNEIRVFGSFVCQQSDPNAIGAVNIETDFPMRIGDLVSFNVGDFLMMGDGKHIDKTYNKDGFINGIKWKNGNGKVLTKTDRYQNGDEYYLSLRITADNGYYFKNNVSAKVEYNDASVIDGNSDYIEIEYYYYPLGYGDEGWAITNDGKRMYYYDDCGNYYRNKLAKIAVKGKNYFYYFDKDGFMVTGWQKIKRGDGKTYLHYFKPNGTLALGWQSIENSKGVAYKYYFGTNGCMVTGWQSIKNSKGVAYKYYFHTNGVMLTGWQSIKASNGKTYKYYFGTNGYMRTGWQSIKNSKGVAYKYYFGANGVMRTGWQWIANAKGVKYRYYFGTNGYMRTGWQKIKASNGKTYWYYFYSNGVNVINKSVKIGKKTYKFNKYGICTNP